MNMTESIDPYLEVLRAQQRRIILSNLKHGDIDSVEDILVRDGFTSQDELELLHAHLPILANRGLIKWTKDTGKIAKGPEFQSIEPLLDLIEAHIEDLPYRWP